MNNQVEVVLIPAIISALVSLIGVWFSYKNNGKQLEIFKHKLELKENSSKKNIEVYQNIQNVYNYIIEGYMNFEFIDDRILELKDIFEKNKIYISDSINQKISEIISDISSYNNNLVEMRDLKVGSSGIESATAQKMRDKISVIDSEQNDILKKLKHDFDILTDDIKKEL